MNNHRTPTVSVIIPLFNRLQYVEHALDSVFNQTRQELEVVVVDDGSRVDVRPALRRHAHRIRLIHQPNRGLAAARNTGIANSTGRYLAFLDDDDLFEPRKVEVQCALLDARPEVGFVYSDTWEFQFDSPNDATLNRAVGFDQPADKFPALFLRHPNVRVPSFLLRRECIIAGGWFDEDLPQHEDGDLLLRMALRWPVAYSEEPSCRVRGHGNQMSHDRRTMLFAMLRSYCSLVDAFPEFALANQEFFWTTLRHQVSNHVRASVRQHRWPEARIVQAYAELQARLLRQRLLARALA